MARRTHSSIDRLPDAIKETITRMVTEGYWPDEFGDEHEGKPTYDHVTEYIVVNGYAVSRSAVGRWAKQLLVYERMTLSRDLARQIMSGVDSDNSATEVQKAAAEMMTAQILNVLTDGDLSARDIAMISGAIRDCTQVALKADQYIQKQIADRAAAAADAVTEIAKKKQIDPDTLKMIREQIYGIVD